MNRKALISVVLALGAFAPAASAHARPHAYWRTYPVASSLCSRVAAGQTPKRLAADAAQISAACTTLSNSYEQAVSGFETAVAPIAAQVKSTLAGLAAARRAAVQSHDRSTYITALQQAVTTLQGLRAQERSAAQAYVTAIRAARRTFWTTIHSLPGAGSLPSDSGNPAPPSSPTVPVLS
ncbi:MAG TPA: hypothetical protein VMD09_05505 [Solirubrobacteraceae bacterium]|nr:hypothetical protein [Solirubrobacteraceae bacterium]